MSNPTSSFGWQMPTPTDLVTDLPADFEVFGQAVDSTFADLKGGTTGQILSKATNTDMDFVWITNDQGDITAVNVTSPITGGGTSGAVTVGIQSASTSQSGAVQLSDSTSTTSSVLAATPTAVKSAYDLAASAYAPAFTNNFYAGKNKIINGDFRINQRNFSSTTTNGDYGFDRWTNGLTTGGGTVTFSAQTFTLGAAPVAGYEGTNFFRCVTSGQANTDARAQFRQNIESVRTLAGQTATISFWAKAATGTPSLNVEMLQVFGSGGSPSASVSTVGTKQAITTSWVRYSFTLAIPSISGKTLGTTGDMLRLNIWASAGSDNNAASGTLGIQNNTFDIWGVQLEAGSVATPFQTASGSIGGELALCQRYYWRETPGTPGSRYTAMLGATSGTDSYGTINNPVPMRTTPTSVDYSALNVVNAGTSTFAVTSITLNASLGTKNNSGVSVFVASGLTTGQWHCIQTSTSSGYIGFSAEL